MSNPTLRGRVVLKFPADVLAGPGILIDKNGATYTFELDLDVIQGIVDEAVEGVVGLPEAPMDGQQYGRESGAWTPIMGDGGAGTDTTVGDFVEIAGDTMTGELIIEMDGASLTLDDTAIPFSHARLRGSKSGVPKWDIVLGDATQRFVLANGTVGNVMVGGLTNGTCDFYGGIQARAPASNIALQCMARSGAPLVDISFVSPAGLTWAAIEAKPAALGVAHNNMGNVILHAGGVNVWEARAGTVVVAASDAYKPGGGFWLATSDERIKTVLAPYEEGLKEVCGLNPVWYKYKGNVKMGEEDETSQHAVVAKEGKEYVGLVAQEVEKVLPRMVTKAKGLIDDAPVDDLRSLDATQILYALVNAVKELTARIAVLEGKE